MSKNFNEKIDDLLEGLGSLKLEGGKAINRMATKYPKLYKEKTALVIIDIQDKLAPVMEYREETIKNTNVLVEMCNAYDMPVIATEQYPRGLGHTIEEISKNFKDDAKIVEKISFSAYELIKDYLDEKGIKQVIMTGMETHVCVFQTARDLAYNGYDVHIVEDAVDSRFKTNFRSGLELMRDMGINISNTETVLFDVMEEAANDTFRRLSALIK